MPCSCYPVSVDCTEVLALTLSSLSLTSSSLSLLTPVHPSFPPPSFPPPSFPLLHMYALHLLHPLPPPHYFILSIILSSPPPLPSSPLQLDMATRGTLCIQEVHPSISPKHSCLRILARQQTLYASCGSSEDLQKWLRQ